MTNDYHERDGCHNCISRLPKTRTCCLLGKRVKMWGYCDAHDLPPDDKLAMYTEATELAETVLQRQRARGEAPICGACRFCGKALIPRIDHSKCGVSLAV